MFQSPTYLRMFLMIFLTCTVSLPLSLLRNVDSLSGVAMCSLFFYFCLCIRVCGCLPYIHVTSTDNITKQHNTTHLRIILELPQVGFASPCMSQMAMHLCPHDWIHSPLPLSPSPPLPPFPPSLSPSPPLSPSLSGNLHVSVNHHRC